jgi:outer membrane protein assembly factor BamB
MLFGIDKKNHVRFMSVVTIWMLLIAGFVGINIVTDQASAAGPTDFQGVIKTNTTLTYANSPYIVKGNVLVEKGAVLTIDAGVELRFDGEYYLQIEGKLIAIGYDDNMIKFTSNKATPKPGDWNAIIIRENSDHGSIIKYCTVEYSERGIHLDTHGSSVPITITYNRIINNEYKGIWFQSFKCSPTIDKVLVANNLIYKNLDGIDLQLEDFLNSKTKFIIENNTILRNYIGIYFTWIKFDYDTELSVHYNNIYKNSYYDMLNTEEIYETDVNATYNWWGTTNSSLIDEHIYDFYDNYNFGEVIYKPFLTEFYTNAPPEPNEPPVANAGPDQNGTIFETIYFTGSASYDPNDDPLQYKWDFGDGTKTTWLDDYNIAHIYTAPGVYVVNLSVRDPKYEMDYDTCTVKVTSISTQLDDSPWPKFRGNIKNTGLSKYDTSKNGGKEIWKFGTGDIVFSSPVIDANGTIYVGSDDQFLYAIKSDGTLKWKVDMGYQIHSSPVIGSDGMIYLNNGGHFYAINPNGTVKWKIGGGTDSSSSPTIGPDGMIYYSSYGFLNALYPNGALKWNYKIGSVYKSSPAIDSNGVVYAGSHDYFYAVYPNGTLKWRFNPGNDQIYSSPAIGSDGTIYIGPAHDYTVALYPNGTEKWRINAPIGHSTAAIAADGTIYISAYKHFYAVYPNGTVKWTLKIEGGDSSPAIGSDGTVFVASDDNHLYAINPDGTQRWRFETGKAIASSPAIGSDGTIYIGSNDYYLYAIKGIYVKPNRAPVADAGPDRSIKVNVTVKIDGSKSYDPDLDNLTYSWDFGDGNSLKNTSLAIVNHIYSKPGNYTVTLEVSDGDLTDTDTCVITVSKVNVTKQNLSVAITYPTDSAVVTGDVNISGKLYGFKNITPDVKLKIDEGNWLTPNIYEWYDWWHFYYNWNTKSVSDGVHKIKVVASDGSKNEVAVQITVIVKNKNNITEPPKNQTDIDTDNDGVPDIIDPNPLSNIDTDADNLSDDYETVISLTDPNNPDTDGDGYRDDIDGFPLDPHQTYKDTDNDGVQDYEDAFPEDPAASVDSDGDGYPDKWNPGSSEENSTTGLMLDAFLNDTTEWIDSDGDGVGDNSDAYPRDPTKYMEPKQEEGADQSNNMAIIIGIIIVLILVILILITIVTKRKHQVVEEPPSDKKLIHQVMREIFAGDEKGDMEISDSELKSTLERKYQNGEISKDTYDFISNKLIIPREDGSNTSAINNQPHDERNL